MSSRKVWTAEDLAEAGYGSTDARDVYSITDASEKHSNSVDKRAREYAFRMFLRIVCIIAAVFVDGWLRWVFVALAGILPWVAVVVANGNDRQQSNDFMAYLTEEQQLALTSNAHEKQAQDSSGESATQDTHPDAHRNSNPDEPVIIDGEVVTDSPTTLKDAS
ncbi:DUF3099 domain-containing protein [Rothia terrae]|uniref:DUF3099 domain-containing protein n=1 Tax=Rothia terrae TaxID=396015 RepID=UPI003405F89D